MATSSVKAEFTKLEAQITAYWPSLVAATDLLSNYITVSNGVPQVTTPATNPDPALLLVLNQIMDTGINASEERFIQPLPDNAHIKQWWTNISGELTDLATLISGLATEVATYTAALP
jgi:hypothetical protein